MNQKFVYFAPTKIYFGENQLENLGSELKQFGKRVITDLRGWFDQKKWSLRQDHD